MPAAQPIAAQAAAVYLRHTGPWFVGLLAHGSAIRAFYAAVNAYYPAEATVQGRLGVIESGVAFLAAAKAWWAEQPQEQ